MERAFINTTCKTAAGQNCFRLPTGSTHAHDRYVIWGRDHVTLGGFWVSKLTWTVNINNHDKDASKHTHTHTLRVAWVGVLKRWWGFP